MAPASEQLGEGSCPQWAGDLWRCDAWTLVERCVCVQPEQSSHCSHQLNASVALGEQQPALQFAVLRSAAMPVGAR